MKTYSIPGTDLQPTRIAYGCRKPGGSWDGAYSACHHCSLPQAHPGMLRGDALDLSREEWVRLFTAGRGETLP